MSATTWLSNKIHTNLGLRAFLLSSTTSPDQRRIELEHQARIQLPGVGFIEGFYFQMLQNERRSDERLTEMRAIARAAAFSRALEGEGFRRQTFRVFRRVRRGPSKLSEVWCVDDIVDVDTGVVSRVIDRSKALLLPFVTAASKIVGLIAGLMNWLVDL